MWMYSPQIRIINWFISSCDSHRYCTMQMKLMTVCGHADAYLLPWSFELVSSSVLQVINHKLELCWGLRLSPIFGERNGRGVRLSAQHTIPSPPICFPRKLEIGLILIQVLSHPKHTSTMPCSTKISLKWPYLRRFEVSLDAGCAVL